MTWTVVEESDLGPDKVLAEGFPTEGKAWSWAADYALYYSKRYRRYVFLRVEEDPDGKTHRHPPHIPKHYTKDKRSVIRRLLDL